LELLIRIKLTAPPCLAIVIKERSGGYAPLLAALAASSFGYGDGTASKSFPGLMNMLPFASGPSKT